MTKHADMTYRLSDGRETTYKVELLPESEWPGKEQEIWFQAGVTGERQRIIKLLESLITPCNCDVDCMADDNPAYQELIELIKGETKPFIIAAQVEQMVDEMLEE